MLICIFMQMWWLVMRSIAGEVVHTTLGVNGGKSPPVAVVSGLLLCSAGIVCW